MLNPEKHGAAIEGFLASRKSSPVRLRLATVEDAELILSLRLDPGRNGHISSTSNSVVEQREWMRAYMGRFIVGSEAYFIIQFESEDVGTVRLYDYRPDKDSFCWGSWIIRSGIPDMVAFSTPLMVYDLGFEHLGFSSAHFDIRKANTAVWKFEEMLGAELSGEDGLDRRYIYPKSKYPAAKARMTKIIGKI
jgi:RimJ/RimL family protein N-acetyltransferase